VRAKQAIGASDTVFDIHTITAIFGISRKRYVVAFIAIGRFIAMVEVGTIECII